MAPRLKKAVAVQMSPWEKHLFLEDLKVFVAVSKRIEARLAKKKTRKAR